MAQPSSSPPVSKYFLLTYPAPYVAHVEINRPEKMNAFIETMWLDLHTIFTYLSSDPSTRAIVLSGAGPKAFSAGLDVQSPPGPLASKNAPSSTSSSYPPALLDGARTATAIRQHLTEFQKCVSSIELCAKPVLAVLHGYSYGLAIDIACCADVRYATPDVKFSVKEVDIGIAADVGSLSRLPKIVGAGSWVKDVCLSGRVFGAEEARGYGFVSRVVEGGKAECVREGVRWATMIAGKSPVAVQGTKELLNFSRDHSVAEGLRYTTVWNSAALQTNDVAAAMTAGTQKKTPRFEKL